MGLDMTLGHVLELNALFRRPSWSPGVALSKSWLQQLGAQSLLFKAEDWVAEDYYLISDNEIPAALRYVLAGQELTPTEIH